MSDKEFNELRELSWRRPLNAVEEAQVQAFLAANPEFQADWEEESALTHTLGQLPAVPLSSNFTALVLQGLDRPQPSRSFDRSRGLLGWIHRRLRPVLATAAMFILVAGYTGHRIRHERALDKGAQLISSAIEPEVFANFDNIQKLGPIPPMDEQLWVALNQ